MYVLSAVTQWCTRNKVVFSDFKNYPHLQSSFLHFMGERRAALPDFDLWNLTVMATYGTVQSTYAIPLHPPQTYIINCTKLWDSVLFLILCILVRFDRTVQKTHWVFLVHVWAAIISTERWLMLLSCVTLGRKHLFLLFYWQSASISLIKYLLGSSLSSSPLIWCHVVVPDWIYVQHQASADLLFTTPAWSYACHVKPNTSTLHTKHTGFMTSCAHFFNFLSFLFCWFAQTLVILCAPAAHSL